MFNFEEIQRRPSDPNLFHHTTNFLGPHAVFRHKTEQSETKNVEYYVLDRVSKNFLSKFLVEPVRIAESKRLFSGMKILEETWAFMDFAMDKR